MKDYLIRGLSTHRDTCPVTHLRDGCVTYIIDNDYYYRYIRDTKRDIKVIAPLNACKDSRLMYFDDPLYAFTMYHNHIHRWDEVIEPVIGSNCNIHSSVVLNVEGIRFATASDGSKIQFIHTGSLVIGDNVDVGPHSVIHRGTMGPTTIEDGVKIGSLSNIGHNAQIGKNTIIAIGVVVNGSARIGKNCYIWSGALVRNRVQICDNAKVGTGAVVLDDITTPGTYVGVPAKKLNGGT